RRADEPGLSRLRRVVRLEHGGQLYHGRPYDRASSTRGPGRKTCSFAPDVAGLSGIAKPAVSHGLNPTILRQARALALSFSSRRPPSLDRPPLPPERFSPPGASGQNPSLCTHTGTCQKGSEQTFTHCNDAVFALDTKSCLDDHGPEPSGPPPWTWDTGCEVSASANTRPLFARTRSTARYCRSLRLKT